MLPLAERIAEREKRLLENQLTSKELDGNLNGKAVQDALDAAGDGETADEEKTPEERVIEAHGNESGTVIGDDAASGAIAATGNGASWPATAAPAKTDKDKK